MVWKENSDARMPVIPGGGTRRYNSLDKLKAICAFLVVCIHAPMPGQIGAYFTVITRIAVPIFFVISGFFYRPAKARNQIKKVALLFISGNLIYFLVRFMSAVLKKNSRAFIGELLAPKNIIAFILFNESHMYAHLWYLGAILYVLLITTILLKWNSKKGKKLLYYLTPVLLLGDLMLGKYSLFLWHREFPYVVVRNWLFVGVPYFAIGMWISDHASSVRGKVTKRCAMVLMVVFSIMGIMERITLERFGLNASRDHYASTTFLAVTVFLFFLYYVAREENFMSRIGRNDSTWVYIIHPLIISFLDAAIARTGVHGKIVYLYIRPFMVFIISIFIVEVTRRFILKRKGTVI